MNLVIPLSLNKNSGFVTFCTCTYLFNVKSPPTTKSFDIDVTLCKVKDTNGIKKYVVIHYEQVSFWFLLF